jgi:hypothetical protein
MANEQMLECQTCGQITRHRATPPDGWLRCERCVPPAPVVVMNQQRGKSFLLHYVVPAIVLGVLLGYAVKDSAGC